MNAVRTLLITGLLVGAAHADTRYQIYPSYGEFVKTSSPCLDPKDSTREKRPTRDELYNRVLAYRPVLVIDARQVMNLIMDGFDHLADEMSGGDGWWNFIGKAETKKMIISLSPSNKPERKVITIGVVRYRGNMTCSEKWQGIVEEIRHDH